MKTDLPIGSRCIVTTPENGERHGIVLRYAFLPVKSDHRQRIRVVHVRRDDGVEVLYPDIESRVRPEPPLSMGDVEALQAVVTRLAPEDQTTVLRVVQSLTFSLQRAQSAVGGVQAYLDVLNKATKR